MLRIHLLEIKQLIYIKFPWCYGRNILLIHYQIDESQDFANIKYNDIEFDEKTLSWIRSAIIQYDLSLLSTFNIVNWHVYRTHSCTLIIKKNTNVIGFITLVVDLK